MQKSKKKRQPPAGTIQQKAGDEPGCRVTKFRINAEVDVGTRNGWICFWTAGHEVQIGPLTAEQAQKLADDLAYDAAE